MNQVIIFMTGVFVGGLVFWLYAKRERKSKKLSLIERQKVEKEQDKEGIMGLLESGNESLTNVHVKIMLGIPESTATRYFDELEKEGKIRQVGKTGVDVHYEKVK